MKLKPTTFDVAHRMMSSESVTVTDEDIEKCLAVKRWFQDNNIPITKFAWFTAVEWNSGDWYTPNLDGKDTAWYEITD
jgi:hypothetical protein